MRCDDGLTLIRAWLLTNSRLWTKQAVKKTFGSYPVLIGKRTTFDLLFSGTSRHSRMRSASTPISAVAPGLSVLISTCAVSPTLYCFLSGRIERFGYFVL